MATTAETPAVASGTSPAAPAAVSVPITAKRHLFLSSEKTPQGAINDALTSCFDPNEAWSAISASAVDAANEVIHVLASEVNQQHLGKNFRVTDVHRAFTMLIAKIGEAKMVEMLRKLERKAVGYSASCSVCYLSEDGSFCPTRSCRRVKVRTQAVLSSIRQQPLMIQAWLCDTWYAATKSRMTVPPIPGLLFGEPNRRLLAGVEEPERRDMSHLSSASCTAEALTPRVGAVIMLLRSMQAPLLNEPGAATVSSFISSLPAELQSHIKLVEHCIRCRPSTSAPVTVTLPGQPATAASSSAAPSAPTCPQGIDNCDVWRDSIQALIRTLIRANTDPCAHALVPFRNACCFNAGEEMCSMAVYTKETAAELAAASASLPTASSSSSSSSTHAASLQTATERLASLTQCARTNSYQGLPYLPSLSPSVGNTVSVAVERVHEALCRAALLYCKTTHIEGAPTAAEVAAMTREQAAAAVRSPYRVSGSACHSYPYLKWIGDAFYLAEAYGAVSSSSSASSSSSSEALRRVLAAGCTGPSGDGSTGNAQVERCRYILGFDQLEPLPVPVPSVSASASVAAASAASASSAEGSKAEAAAPASAKKGGRGGSSRAAAAKAKSAASAAAASTATSAIDLLLEGAAQAEAGKPSSLPVAATAGAPSLTSTPAPASIALGAHGSALTDMVEAAAITVPAKVATMATNMYGTATAGKKIAYASSGVHLQALASAGAATGLHSSHRAHLIAQLMASVAGQSGPQGPLTAAGAGKALAGRLGLLANEPSSSPSSSPVPGSSASTSSSSAAATTAAATTAPVTVSSLLSGMGAGAAGGEGNVLSVWCSDGRHAQSVALPVALMRSAAQQNAAQAALAAQVAGNDAGSASSSSSSTLASRYPGGIVLDSVTADLLSHSYAALQRENMGLSLQQGRVGHKAAMERVRRELALYSAVISLQASTAHTSSNKQASSTSTAAPPAPTPSSKRRATSSSSSSTSATAVAIEAFQKSSASAAASNTSTSSSSSSEETEETVKALREELQAFEKGTRRQLELMSLQSSSASLPASSSSVGVPFKQRDWAGLAGVCGSSGAGIAYRMRKAAHANGALLHSKDEYGSCDIDTGDDDVDVASNDPATVAVNLASESALWLPAVGARLPRATDVLALPSASSTAGNAADKSKMAVDDDDNDNNDGSNSNSSGSLKLPPFDARLHTLAAAASPVAFKPTQPQAGGTSASDAAASSPVSLMRDFTTLQLQGIAAGVIQAAVSRERTKAKVTAYAANAASLADAAALLGGGAGEAKPSKGKKAASLIDSGLLRLEPPPEVADALEASSSFDGNEDDDDDASVARAAWARVVRDWTDYYVSQRTALWVAFRAAKPRMAKARKTRDDAVMASYGSLGLNPSTGLPINPLTSSSSAGAASQQAEAAMIAKLQKEALAAEQQADAAFRRECESISFGLRFKKDRAPAIVEGAYRYTPLDADMYRITTTSTTTTTTSDNNNSSNSGGGGLSFPVASPSASSSAAPNPLSLDDDDDLDAGQGPIHIPGASPAAATPALTAGTRGGVSNASASSSSSAGGGFVPVPLRNAYHHILLHRCNRAAREQVLAGLEGLQSHYRTSCMLYSQEMSVGLLPPPPQPTGPGVSSASSSSAPGVCQAARMAVTPASMVAAWKRMVCYPAFTHRLTSVTTQTATAYLECSSPLPSILDPLAPLQGDSHTHASTSSVASTAEADPLVPAVASNVVSPAFAEQLRNLHHSHHTSSSSSASSGALAQMTTQDAEALHNTANLTSSSASANANASAKGAHAGRPVIRVGVADVIAYLEAQLDLASSSASSSSAAASKRAGNKVDARGAGAVKAAWGRSAASVDTVEPLDERSTNVADSSAAGVAGKKRGRPAVQANDDDDDDNSGLATASSSSSVSAPLKSKSAGARPTATVAAPAPFLGSHPRVRELLKWAIGRGRMLAVAESGAIEASNASGADARPGKQVEPFKGLLGSTEAVSGSGVFSSVTAPFASSTGAALMALATATAAPLVAPAPVPVVAGRAAAGAAHR